ncbi:unnamed protein product [Caenorhabditis nigoni]
MSAPPAPVDAFTMMTRALTSLRLQGADLRNPSLSMSSILAVGPHELGMKFPASEFMERGVIDGLSLIRTALVVSRAAWEMTLDEPEKFAYQDVDAQMILEHPNSDETIKIVVHTFPAPPPALSQLECSATVVRDGFDVMILKGSSLIRVLPPPPPALVSNVPAPLLLPFFVDDSAVPVPLLPVQEPIEPAEAPPLLTKKQKRRMRKERWLIRKAAASEAPECKPPPQI